MKIIVLIFKWIRKNILYILGYAASFYIAIYLISKCQEEREQEHFREIARQEKVTKRLQEEEKKRLLEEEQRKQKEEQRKQEEERRLKEEREIQSGKIDGHAFVDLGLPSGTLWAKMNIGASSEEEAGEYFAWGETSGYIDVSERCFSKDEYIYYDETYDRLTKYCSSAEHGKLDNKTELESIDDAATANWGANWQMPSKEQINELHAYCTLRKCKKNGIDGWLLFGPNDSLLFIPPNSVIEDGKIIPLYKDYPFAAFWSRNQASVLGLGFVQDEDAAIVSLFDYYELLDSVRTSMTSRKQIRWSGLCVRPVVKNRNKKTSP